MFSSFSVQARGIWKETKVLFNLAIFITINKKYYVGHF